MTAPSATARTTPTVAPLGNGYQTLITFASNPDVPLWEKTVQPFGFDTGDAVETTTMHNSVYHTKAPRALLDTTEMNMVVAYPPAVLPEVIALLGVNQVITIKHPNGATWAFWGYLKTFEPQDNENGSQPEANCTIVPTNTDSDGAEQAPVYAAPPT